MVVVDNRRRKKIYFSLSLTGEQGQYNIYYKNNRSTLFLVSYLIIVFVAIRPYFPKNILFVSFLFILKQNLWNVYKALVKLWLHCYSLKRF